MSSSSDDGAGLLEVGRIEKSHGLRGEVVVTLVTNMVEARTAPGTVLQTDDGPLTVEGARPHGHRWLIRFAGIADRDTADRLRGRVLLAEPIALDGAPEGPLGPDAEHGSEVVAFVHELIGSRLVDQQGVDHGPIVAVIDNPASDLLELSDGALVPLAFFRGRDVEAGTVTVEVPAGLLDGTATEAGR